MAQDYFSNNGPIIQFQVSVINKASEQGTQTGRVHAGVYYSKLEVVAFGSREWQYVVMVNVSADIHIRTLFCME